MSHSVSLEHRGDVVWLTIERPEAMNAMDSHAHLALSDHLDALAGDRNVRVIVLTGRGPRAFSAGRDLKEIAAAQDYSKVEQRELADRWSRVRRLTDRNDFEIPIIARVDGVALGGGFELSLACDIIIASDAATFGLPEPRRGLIPTAGGVHRLPRQIPLKAAMGYLLTGRTMTAARAFELGLVNEVAPAGRLDETVEAWVNDLLGCAPLSLRSIKQCVSQGAAAPLNEAMARPYHWEDIRLASADSREGPRAFAEKRRPVWTGF